MRYSVSDTSQLYNTYNTIEKRYPNGDVSIKRLKFTAFKKKAGWEETEHSFTFLAKVKEADRIGRRIFGDYLWELKCSKVPVIDTSLETLETQTHIEKKPLEEYKFSLSDIKEREKYLERKAMDNIVKTRSKIYDIARSNEWNYFITLTFNEKVVDRHSYQDCINKISRYMRNFKFRNKSNCPNFKYLIIHERHLDGAYHFHGLIYLEDESERMLKKATYPLGHRLGGKPIIKKGKQVYNWNTYKQGYSTVTKIDNLEACCKYILKYVTKHIDDDYVKGRRRFMYSSNCIKPVITELTTGDKDYDGMVPIYDSKYSTGYEYNLVENLTDLFNDIVIIND